MLVDIHRYHELIRDRYNECNADDDPVERCKCVVDNFVMIFHLKIPFLDHHIKIIYRYIY